MHLVSRMHASRGLCFISVVSSSDFEKKTPADKIVPFTPWMDMMALSTRPKRQRLPSMTPSSASSPFCGPLCPPGNATTPSSTAATGRNPPPTAAPSPASRIYTIRPSIFSRTSSAPCFLSCWAFSPSSTLPPPPSRATFRATTTTTSRVTRKPHRRTCACSPASSVAQSPAWASARPTTFSRTTRPPWRAWATSSTTWASCSSSGAVSCRASTTASPTAPHSSPRTGQWYVSNRTWAVVAMPTSA